MNDQTSADRPTGQTYLGDAVYIGRWEGGALLWTSDGYQETNKIFMEPEVISALIRWLAQNVSGKRGGPL